MPVELRLHCRYPQGWNGLSAFLEQTSSLLEHFDADEGLGLSIAVASSVAYNAPPSVSVGTCSGGATTAVSGLFASLLPNLAGANIGAIFVLSMTGNAKWGCAECPPGRRGVLVRTDAPLITLAHEILHLFLGGAHSQSTGNLMFGDTSMVQGIPTLTASQIARVKQGTFQIPAAMAPVAAPTFVVVAANDRRQHRKPSPRKRATKKRASGKRKRPLLRKVTSGRTERAKRRKGPTRG